MNMSFINKIRKLICHRQYINPIVDENIGSPVKPCVE